MNENKKYQDVLGPLGLRVADLRDVWLAAKRGKPEAIDKKYRMLEANPELLSVFTYIAMISQSTLKKSGKKGTKKSMKPARNPSSWEGLQANANKTTSPSSVVSGGLPSLGKR